jgi:hypothetical protein
LRAVGLQWGLVVHREAPRSTGYFCTSGLDRLTSSRSWTQTGRTWTRPSVRRPVIARTAEFSKTVCSPAAEVFGVPKRAEEYSPAVGLSSTTRAY